MSETRCWTILKTLWTERICHLCETKRVKDEKYFLLECPVYTHIRSEFQNLCYSTDLTSLLTYQNHSDIGILLFKLFEHINKKPKKTK